MLHVEMMLSAIFVAVPAFRRVEPVTISGPVGEIDRHCRIADHRRAPRSGLHVSKIVLRSEFRCAPQRAKHKRGSPTRGDAADAITGVYTSLRHGKRTRFRLVLRAFDG